MGNCCGCDDGVDDVNVANNAMNNFNPPPPVHDVNVVNDQPAGAFGRAG